MDQDMPRREPGSRVGVLLVGLLLGAIIMTVVWVALAGNPLSDNNEVIFRDVVISDVTEARDSLCWSEDPQRRDAPQECAILALDPAIDPPQAGDALTIGLVQLRTPDGTEAQQVVHVAPATGGSDDASDDATDSASEGTTTVPQPTATD